jgi:hypothetical protein
MVLFCSILLETLTAFGQDKASQQTLPSPAVDSTLVNPLTPNRWHLFLTAGAAGSSNTQGFTLPTEQQNTFALIPAYSFAFLTYGGSLGDKTFVELSFDVLQSPYKGRSFLSNLRQLIHVGYIVHEVNNFKITPIIGFGSQNIKIDTARTESAVSAHIGVGIDYHIPKTIIIASLRGGYNHVWTYDAIRKIFDPDAPEPQRSGGAFLQLLVGVRFAEIERFGFWANKPDNQR